MLSFSIKTVNMVLEVKPILSATLLRHVVPINDGNCHLTGVHQLSEEHTPTREFLVGILVGALYVKNVGYRGRLMLSGPRGLANSTRARHFGHHWQTINMVHIYIAENFETLTDYEDWCDTQYTHLLF